MATVYQHVAAPIEHVFACISDPTTYPEWLVGAKAIRAVDDGWPQPGCRFHHRVGIAGPLSVDDDTVSTGVDAPRRLGVQARFRPLGRAAVNFELTEVGGGTRVAMEEHPLGALSLVAPLLDPLILARNKQSMRAFAQFAERERTRTPRAPAGSTQ